MDVMQVCVQLDRRLASIIAKGGVDILAWLYDYTYICIYRLSVQDALGIQPRRTETFLTAVIGFSLTLYFWSYHAAKIIYAKHEEHVARDYAT